MAAISRDDNDDAQRLAIRAIDSLLGTFAGSDYRCPTTKTLDPGSYFTLPQGHALMVDATRDTTVMDMGGAVSVGGVDLTDWDQLARLGQHLVFLADRKCSTAGTGAGSGGPRP